MIDALIRWSLHNKLIVLTLAGILLAWGGWQAVRLPVDVLPDLTAPTVTILIEGHGIAPEEMESLVTFPIEAAMNGAAGVRRVRSVTVVGAAIVWVEFDWGEDIYRARQTVNEKLSLVAGSLPDTVDPPVLAPISSLMGEILFLALESDAHSMLDLRTTADTVIRRRILAVPGSLPGHHHRRRRAAVPGPGLAGSPGVLPCDSRRRGARAGGGQPEHVGRLPGHGRPGVPDSRHRPAGDSGRDRRDGGRGPRGPAGAGPGSGHGEDRPRSETGRGFLQRRTRDHHRRAEAARSQHPRSDPPARRGARRAAGLPAGGDDHSP